MKETTRLSTLPVSRRSFTVAAGAAGAAGILAATGLAHGLQASRQAAAAEAPGSSATDIKAASSSANAAASASPDSATTGTGTTANITESCDVLVIGAGGAGAAAAAAAAGEGAKVIWIEKSDAQMGSSVLAMGTFYGAGTDLQKAAGIEDTPEDLLAYFMDRNGSKLAWDIQNFAASNFGETIQWLANDLAVPFKPEPVLRGSDTVPRGHLCANTALDALAPVTQLALDQGADLRFGICAESLLTNAEGAVAGVSARDASGAAIRFEADAVIVATGGFCRNAAMIARYMPEYDGVYTEVGQGCTGEGLQMGLDIGARYIGHGGVNGILFCDVQTGQSKLISKSVLWLDKDGQRFANEAGQTHDLFYQVAKMDGRSFYAIYDQAARDSLNETLAARFQDGLDKGIFAQGETVTEAAAALGLPGDAFQEALDAYNALAAAGEDTQFGKAADNLVPLTTGPYYVLTMGICTHGSFGGYEVNADMQVMSEIGYPIAGLYAAGEVSCGSFIYDDYPAGGCGLNWSYTSGRFAGRNAALAVLGAAAGPGSEAGQPA